jgi:hypothetical protein
MPDNTEVGQEPRQPVPWEALLRKYVSVWIWSILMGVTISVAISFVGVRSSAVRGLVGVALAFPILAGVIAAYGGLMHLLQYLRHHIIPTFLGDSSEREEYIENSERTAFHLYLALKFLIYAILLRLITAALEVAINAFAF